MASCDFLGQLGDKADGGCAVDNIPDATQSDERGTTSRLAAFVAQPSRNVRPLDKIGIRQERDGRERFTGLQLRWDGSIEIKVDSPAIGCVRGGDDVLAGGRPVEDGSTHVLAV